MMDARRVPYDEEVAAEADLVHQLVGRRPPRRRPPPRNTAAAVPALAATSPAPASSGGSVDVRSGRGPVEGLLVLVAVALLLLSVAVLVIAFQVAELRHG